MAIWQFDIALIPAAALEANPEIIDDSVSEAGLETGAWWSYAKLPAELEGVLDAVLPIGKSWSADLEMRGTEDGDRIDVYRNDGAIESIEIRIDVRELDSAFLEHVCELTRRLRCKLYAFESREALEPDLFTLSQAIRRSNAARFVSDPERFFAELAGASES